MSDRRVGVLLIAAGAAVSGLTWAVGEGLVTGVRAAWPAHILAGVLVVIGLVALRRQPDDAPMPREPGPDGRVRGPSRPNPRHWWSYPARRHDPGEFLGGGEPNGRE